MRQASGRQITIAGCVMNTIGVSAKEGSGFDVDRMAASMSLEEKIGQMMVISYLKWEEDGNPARTVENTDTEDPAANITELNDEIRASIAHYHFGGVTLFAENCRDAEQTLRLTADMQQASRDGGGVPLLICIDQEGGNTARLRFGTMGPGNMALTATKDPENIRQIAGIYGQELNLLGINVDFAPVVDVNNNPANPVIGVRSFSDSPQVVAESAPVFMDALHEAGIMATAKHFPGHGNTDVDSHIGFPCINSTYEELKQCELIPFKAMIGAGCDLIMTAHIQYPEIEKETSVSISSGEEVYLPATMSRTILTDILRGDMGFEGVIVSDALDMAAITDHFSTEDVLIKTINAGVDLLLLPLITTREIFEQDQEMVDLAVELTKSGRIDEAMVDASVRRILLLKEQYGLLGQKDFTVTDEAVRAAVEGIGTRKSRQLEWEMALKAATLVKNENGAFPVRLKSGESALFLLAGPAADRIGAGELVTDRLTGTKALPGDAKIRFMASTRDNEGECLTAAVEADHVILISRVSSAECLDPGTEEGFSTAVFDKIIEARHEDGKTVILVSCQLPYDAGRFPEADAVLLAYNSGPMAKLPPLTGAGSGFIANLPAALCACLGEGEPEGTLPVRVPLIRDRYQSPE